MISHRDYLVCFLTTIENNLRQTIGVMSYLLTVIQQVCANDLRLLVKRVVYWIINPNLISALGGIKLRLFLADPPIVYNYKIEMNLRRILLNCFNVFPRAVAVSLSRLRHEIVYEDLRRRRLTDDASHLGNQ